MLTTEERKELCNDLRKTHDIILKYHKQELSILNDAAAEILALEAELKSLRQYCRDTMPPCPGDNPCYCVRCVFESEWKHVLID